MTPERVQFGLRLLRETAERTSIARAAEAIGYSRSAVSLALAGKYERDLKPMAGAAIARLGRVRCPHLRMEIAAEACEGHRSKPMPTSAAAALRHWQACRRCPHNPVADRRATCR